jgi:predicted GIY-YIG superfamily endonuclease
MAPLTDAGEEPYGPERWEEHVATKHPVVPHVSNDSDNDSQDAQVQRNQHATAAKLLRGIDKSLSATSSEVHRGCDDIVQALRQERRRKQLQKPEKRKFMAEYFTWLEIPEQSTSLPALEGR